MAAAFLFMGDTGIPGEDGGDDGLIGNADGGAGHDGGGGADGFDFSEDHFKAEPFLNALEQADAVEAGEQAEQDADDQEEGVGAHPVEKRLQLIHGRGLYNGREPRN